MKKLAVKTLRVSIPISPQVLAKFQRFADASGLSVSKSIGDWLRDTASGLDAMTDILEVHRRSPSKAMEKLSTYASALQDMTQGAMDGMRTQPSPLGEGAPPAGKSLVVAKAAITKASQISLLPPSSNTGGKGTKNNSKLSITHKVKSPKTPEIIKMPKGLKFPLPPAKVQAYADTNGVPPKATK